MKPNFIKDTDILITRYLENKCTPGEKDQLLTLLSSYKNESASKEALFSKLNEFKEDQDENHTVDFEKIYNELVSEIARRESRESERYVLQKRIKVKRFVLQAVSVAAVFCLAFFLGTVFNRHPKTVITEQSVTFHCIQRNKSSFGC